MLEKKLYIFSSIYIVYLMLFYYLASKYIDAPYLLAIAMFFTLIMPCLNMLSYAENMFFISGEIEILLIGAWITILYATLESKEIIYIAAVVLIYILLYYIFTCKKKQETNTKEITKILLMSTSLQYVLTLLTVAFLGKNWVSIGVMWSGLIYIFINRIFIVKTYENVIEKIRTKVYLGTLIELLVCFFVTVFFSKQIVYDPFIVYIDRMVVVVAGSLLEMPFNPFNSIREKLYKMIG